MKSIVILVLLVFLANLTLSAPTPKKYAVAYLWPEPNLKGTPQTIKDTTSGFLENKCYHLDGSPVKSAQSTGTTLILLFERANCEGDLRGELIRGGSKSIKAEDGTVLKPVSVRLVYDRVGSGGF